MQDTTFTHQAEDDLRNNDIQIWLNGALVHKDDAKVSVYDSGFMLGDGVWEGMRLYNGTWAFLDEHMDRLFEAAKAIDLDIGMDRAALVKALHDTQAANDMKTDAHARLMVTRGVKNAALSTSVLVPAGADRDDHHGTFPPRDPAPDPVGDRAAYPRTAHVAGPQAKFPFQTELHSGLHRRRKGRRG